MKFFRQISSLFSSSPQTKTVPKRIQLLELIDHARRSQYIEDYESALQGLSKAIEIAEAEYDSRAKVDIMLSRADILIAQGDLKTAEWVLTELKNDSESRGMKAPLSYTLSSLGVIEQKRANWEQAKNYYEKAREIATSIKTDGASGRAAAHLADVYLHEGNASYAIYLLEAALEKLFRSGDRELLGYFQGQLGLAKIATGHEQDGLLMMQKGLESAKEINYRAQQRELLVLLGEQALNTTNFRRAYQHFLDSLMLYPKPAPQTTDYAKLLCHMSKACLRIQEIDSAKNYAQDALSIAETLEDNSLIAMAKACLGLSLGTEESALPYLQAAAAIFEQAEADPFYIDILRKLATLKVKSGHIEEAEQLYQQAIRSAESMPIEHAQILTEIAKLRSKQKQRRDAIQYWQEALRLYQEANQNQIGRVHCEIGALYEQLGDGRMALREFGYALEQLARVDDTNMRGLVLANVAAAYSEFGDIDTAADFFKESIEIAQRARNRAIEALRRGNYGRLLALSNQAKQASTQLTRAYQMSEESGLSLQTTVMLGNLGLSYAAMGNHDTALEHYQAVLTQFESLNETLWQAIFEANAADSLIALKRYEEAQNNYESALTKIRQEEHVPALVQILIGQVFLALAQTNMESAEAKLKELDPIAKRLQYRRFLALLHQAWSQVYAAQGNTEKAKSAWNEAKQHRSAMRMTLMAPDWL